MKFTVPQQRKIRVWILASVISGSSSWDCLTWTARQQKLLHLHGTEAATLAVPEDQYFLHANQPFLFSRLLVWKPSKRHTAPETPWQRALLQNTTHTQQDEQQHKAPSDHQLYSQPLLALTYPEDGSNCFYICHIRIPLGKGQVAFLPWHKRLRHNSGRALEAEGFLRKRQT